MNPLWLAVGAIVIVATLFVFAALRLGSSGADRDAGIRSALRQVPPRPCKARLHFRLGGRVMAAGSKIEWLYRPGTRPASWNPIRARLLTASDGMAKPKVGWHCEHVHDGCINCYAEKQNEGAFHGGTGLPYKPGHREQDIEVFLDEPTLLAPLGWRQPHTIFVCSMSDLYGSWVPDEWIQAVRAVQALSPRHTYIELTKRPERLRAFQRAATLISPLTACLAELYVEHPLVAKKYPFDMERALASAAAGWPLPNVWAGCSVSRQVDADEFVPIVLDTPLAKRIVSYEPALEAVDFTRLQGNLGRGDDTHVDVLIDALRGRYAAAWRGRETVLDRGHPTAAIDWLIVGGESGAVLNTRPFDLAWARSAIVQCRDAGVACFIKQVGSNPVGSDLVVEGDAPAHRFRDRKGGDPSEWAADLRVREWPNDQARRPAPQRAEAAA